MTTECLDLAAMSRVVLHVSEIEETLRVEQHLRRCGRCLERLARLRRYADNLFEEMFQEPEGDAVGCLTKLQVEHFRRESLSERQLVRLQEHLLRCPECRRRCATRRMPALLHTRGPDVDVQRAAEGVRVARGAEHRVREAPVLAERLAGPSFGAGRAVVTAARRLGFDLRGPGLDLRLHLDLRSPEGFALGLRLQRGGVPQDDAVYALWTRKRVVLRRSVAAGSWDAGELLEPGHYFFGPSEHAAPLLAFCVDNVLLEPGELALAGHDWTRRGAFAMAERCFAAALECEPRPEFGALLEATRRFAARFGVQGRRGEWRLPAPAAPSAPPPPEPEPPGLDAAGFDASRLEVLAALVAGLSQRAEASVPTPGPDPEPTAGFRFAFMLLLRRQRRQLDALQASHPATAGQRGRPS